MYIFYLQSINQNVIPQFLNTLSYVWQINIVIFFFKLKEITLITFNL